jgi:catechol 2,3-dioxygenase-like lactoylglutathione lyase family enzyme
MTVTLSRLHHVGLIVSDLDVAMAFYDKLLDMKPTTRADVDRSAGLARQLQVERAVARVAFYEVSGGVAIELIEMREPQEPKVQPQGYVPGSKHVCFLVDDVDATYEAMKAEGYVFHGEPCHFEDETPELKGTKFAYFRDPDGNILEIIEDPNKKGLLAKAAQTVGLG